MFRILAVDDEPAFLELTRAYLELGGDIQVETTSSPLQALDMLTETPYDVIVADYEMPEMNGIALLQEVRRRGLLTPFIIFSGRGREEAIIEALNSGADFYLQKGGNPAARFAELRNFVLQAARRRLAEVEAKRAGDLYRSVFEYTGSATIIIEGDMTISLANTECERLSGYSREEIEGKMPFTALVAPEDRARMENFHRQRRIDPLSAPRTYEFGLIDREGRRKEIHLTVGIIPGTDRSVASLIDITDRKRFEEELKDAREEMTAAFEEATASQEALEAQCREMEDYQATLRGIIDFLPDPTFALDRDGRIIIWNRAMQELTGVRKDTMIGSGADAISRAIPDLVPPSLAEKILAGTMGESPAREVRITSPRTGEEVYLWAKASPLYDAGGNLAGAIESMRDITRSKQMADQIQRRITLEQLVRLISTRFISLDPVDLDDALQETLELLGSFLGVDRSYILRFSADLTHAENTHEWCAEGVESQIDVLFNLPEHVITWGLDNVRARRTICVPDLAALPDEEAEIRDFLLDYGISSIILVPITSTSEPLGIIGFETAGKKRRWSNEDITLLEIVGNLFSDLFSRLRAQERLLENEERFRTLIESSHDCYIRVTASPRKVDYISPSSERLIGYTPEEILGDPDFIERVVHPDDREMLRALLEDPGGYTSREGTLRVRRKDGHYIWFEVSAIPVYGNKGQPVAFHYAIHDIDAWKQAEAALIRANKKLNLMNNIVRHDILNQVTVVLGHLALLREEPLDPAVAGALDRIEIAAEIIKSQIGFTRDYQDLGVRAPQWFPVGALVREAVKTLRPKGIRVSTDLDDLYVYADPLLSSVFYNLLENSMRHGKTVTEIRVTAMPDDGGARIIWEDNGIGIPVENKPRIFDRGFGSHTGLGLFLA
ncbi:PAS domain S-box protein, partial [Methanoculleus sp.]|uniref:PAS domain S-box protein n=1 Tax=Methanoculleus sp. TaxID=90427 RepID=UPI0026054782